MPESSQDQPPPDVSGHWVELREESSPGRIVLKRFSADIPPARGRRSLHLAGNNVSTTEAPGPDDRGVPVGDGDWRFDGGVLSVGAPGWEGRYRIQRPNPETLILVPEAGPER